jgi:signal transduction histidine kinase
VEQTLHRCLEDEQTHQVNFRLAMPAGSGHWVLLMARQTPGINGSVVSGVCMDITTRRELNVERDRLQAAERAAAMATETANRMKHELLSTVSHELRTPLNAILSWTHLVRTGNLDQAAILKAAETIERNAKMLAQLIESILDVSRIASGKLRLFLKPVNFISVVEAAVEVIRPAANAKSIHLDLKMESNALMVAADPDRLHQIVWSLLSNATKFTPVDGRIKVELRNLGSEVEFKVENSGVGIDHEFLPRVFEAFEQADRSTTRERGGVGLGLAITKHLVELHGGRIFVTSGSGEGATFRVVLPLDGR